jgi:hypothetical protein
VDLQEFELELRARGGEAYAFAYAAHQETYDARLAAGTLPKRY